MNNPINVLIMLFLSSVVCGLVYSLAAGSVELSPTVCVGGAVALFLLIAMIKDAVKESK